MYAEIFWALCSVYDVFNWKKNVFNCAVVYTSVCVCQTRLPFPHLAIFWGGGGHKTPLPFFSLVHLLQ